MRERLRTSDQILIRAAAESNVGNARGNNEDNVYFNGDYITPRNISRPFALKTGDYTDINVFAVLDGMGRNNTGSFASLVAATKLDAVTDKLAFDNEVDPDEAVLAYMQDANEAIREQRQETGGVRTASTLALLILEHGNAHVYNVGDSRVYLYRDKQLVKLTRDHVAVEGQRTVALSEEGIRSGRITKFLGMNAREGRLEPYRAKPFK
ncbi:MAG: protein serine/threonine phosphatase 2C family protein, partial [Clostridia bacterium]|nr:protein serine/threonine phosphatase 2C family protein [Clostridia bacterium]